MNATLDDLRRERGWAELVGGRIVHIRPLGYFPSQVSGRIARSLFDYADASGRGEACQSKLAYVIPRLKSGRESLSPAASYYDGPLPADPMSFIEGPPTFAVEVRGEHDYESAAERAIADKRRDYFASGTKVVWDVDTVNEVIYVHRPDQPEKPTVYRHGDTAEAEPAVPGWRVAVDWIFA